jgi:hypothetical protein
MWNLHSMLAESRQEELRRESQADRLARRVKARPRTSGGGGSMRRWLRTHTRREG